MSCIYFKYLCLDGTSDIIMLNESNVLPNTNSVTSRLARDGRLPEYRL